MVTEYVSVSDCCLYHHIEASFVYELRDAGLLEITVVDTQEVIALDRLPELEQYIRWHYDMDINTEGMETIRHLLGRMKQLQHEVDVLKARLRLYE